MKGQLGGDLPAASEQQQVWTESEGATATVSGNNSSSHVLRPFPRAWGKGPNADIFLCPLLPSTT